MDVDDVLRVELEIEPRAAIGDNARGEEIFARRMGLAAIMIEQHARRAVHLADDHALGAVDDERAVLRHERHVAHVDVLLLDIEDGAGFRIGIDLEHDQAQRDAHRGGIGDAALAALVGVVFRRLQLILDEIQLRRAREVADREDRTQRLLQAGHIAVLGPRAQELLVALALHLDEVGHLHDFVDVSEDLADALLGRRHRNCLGRHVVFPRANENFARLSAECGQKRRSHNDEKCGSGPSEPHCLRHGRPCRTPQFVAVRAQLRTVSRRGAGWDRPRSEGQPRSSLTG